MAGDILIVDDEQDIRALIQGILEDDGYITRAASNSTKAYDAFEKRIPDLVILDIWLQGSEHDGIQILENLKEWWTNPEKGIKKDEELYAILFEYDYFFQKNVEAVAYGIGAYENYQIQTDKFDMGHDYDFTTAFYSSPGISLDFFDSLGALDHDNLPEKFKDTTIDFDKLKIGEPIEVDGLNDIEDLLGYQEIIELHKLQGMLAIHEVLVKLDVEKEFEPLNYKDNFMFFLQTILVITVNVVTTTFSLRLQHESIKT